MPEPGAVRFCRCGREAGEGARIRQLECGRTSAARAAWRSPHRGERPGLPLQTATAARSPVQAGTSGHSRLPNGQPIAATEVATDRTDRYHREPAPGFACALCPLGRHYACTTCAHASSREAYPAVGSRRSCRTPPSWPAVPSAVSRCVGRWSLAPVSLSRPVAVNSSGRRSTDLGCPVSGHPSDDGLSTGGVAISSENADGSDSQTTWHSGKLPSGRLSGPVSSGPGR